MAGGHTRAGFLGTGAAALGGAALAGTWQVDRAAAAAAVKIEDGTVTPGAFDARFYGDSFYFELDGKVAGRVEDVGGGNAVADIVVEKLGSDYLAKKHISNVKYEDITASFGTGMSKGFYDWIKSSFDGKATRKSGAIVALDKSGAITGRGQFTNALITEVGFPALDAGAKDAAKLSLKMAAEKTEWRSAEGKARALGGGVPNISAANFKVEIEGLSTGKISRVEGYPVKWEGPDLDATAPPTMTVPDLAFIFSGDLDQDWADYFNSFVIKGENSDDKERAGTVHLMDKKSNELFTISFSHLGIFKHVAETNGTGADAIRRIKAEMYCEDIRFSYSAAATFG